jgi:hypothetical protein
MTPSRTFSGVTPEVLARLRARPSGRYQVHVGADGSNGTISGSTPVGELVVDFQYARERGTATVTIRSKPRLVPAGLVWAEIAGALRSAGADPGAPRNA